MMTLRPAQIVDMNRLSQSKTVTPQIEAGPPKIDFSGVLDRVRNNGGDLHAELVTLREKIVSGKSFSNQELLYYQVRAGEFGMKVELFSKVAESLSATLRKFQQGSSS